MASINSINSVSSDGNPNATSRPGRKPSRPDDELLPEELYRRNRRRQRNREAAARIRDKRLKQTSELEMTLQKVGFQRSDYRGRLEVKRSSGVILAIFGHFCKIEKARIGAISWTDIDSA